MYVSIATILEYYYCYPDAVHAGTNPLHQIPTDRRAVPDGLNRNPKTPGKLHTYLNRFTLPFLIVGQKDAKTHAEFPDTLSWIR